MYLVLDRSPGKAASRPLGVYGSWRTHLPRSTRSHSSCRESDRQVAWLWCMLQVVSHT